jgi:hypothetical protein
MEPGQCISVDQLESTTPGLIAQNKGWLTKKRYRVATVFVDHFSGLSYIHLQKSTNAEETLEARLTFERFASKFKVQVKRNQADNGRFAENKFMAAVKETGQTITFCGVNAHFQNAVAERRIRTLQDQARTMLIMLNTHGPRLLMLISGLMLSEWPKKFTTLHLQLEEKITSLPFSCLQGLKSLQI